MNETTIHNSAKTAEAVTERNLAQSSGTASDDFFSRVEIAVQAAEEKKAQDITVLKLSALTSFTDYFVICTGNAARQVQAISDEIERRLKQEGVRPLRIEGYNNAEWILIDYGPMVVHIFSEKSRRFYDLERLWRDAERITIGSNQSGNL